MKEYYFRIRDKQQDPAEINRLTAMEFKFSPPGSAELADAFKWFGVSILVAVIGFLFGGWVIRNFRGPGVIIFGYGAKYLLPPIMLIYGLYCIIKLFRPAHKKKAASAMKWMWLVSILGDDAAGERFGKLNYSKETMNRLLPQGTGFHPDRFGGYVTALRGAMDKALDEVAETMRKAGWNMSTPDKSLTVMEERELQQNVHELHAELFFQDGFTKSESNKTLYAKGTVLKLDIVQTFVRAGEYWFPYDTMPSFVQTSAPQGTEESGADTTNNS